MKIFLVILIWIVALVAFNALYWAHRSVNRYRNLVEYFDTAFKALKDDREEMKKRLLEFKTWTGRYPTNDEGLSVVAYSLEEQTTAPGFMNYRGNLHLNKFESAEFSEAPYIYENRIGLPKNSFKHSPVKKDPKEYYSTKIDDNIFIYSIGALALYERYIESSPIFSFYFKITIFCLIEILLLFLFVLFSVNNRAKAIAKSRAAKYTLRSLLALCGILLIFLICLDPRQTYYSLRNKILDPLLWTHRNESIYYYVAAAFVLLIALLIISELTSEKKSLLRFGKYAMYFLFAAVTAFTFQSSFVTCYPPFHVAGWRRKESYSKYLELLAKYRDSKVIKQETFDQIKQTLDLELAKDEEE